MFAFRFAFSDPLRFCSFVMLQLNGKSSRKKSVLGCNHSKLEENLVRTGLRVLRVLLLWAFMCFAQKRGFWLYRLRVAVLVVYQDNRHTGSLAVTIRFSVTSLTKALLLRSLSENF